MMFMNINYNLLVMQMLNIDDVVSCDKYVLSCEHDSWWCCYDVNNDYDIVLYNVDYHYDVFAYDVNDD